MLLHAISRRINFSVFQIRSLKVGLAACRPAVTVARSASAVEFVLGMKVGANWQRRLAPLFCPLTGLARQGVASSGGLVAARPGGSVRLLLRAASLRLVRARRAVPGGRHCAPLSFSRQRHRERRPGRQRERPQCAGHRRGSPAFFGAPLRIIESVEDLHSRG